MFEGKFTYERRPDEDDVDIIDQICVIGNPQGDMKILLFDHEKGERGFTLPYDEVVRLIEFLEEHWYPIK